MHNALYIMHKAHCIYSLHNMHYIAHIAQKTLNIAAASAASNLSGTECNLRISLAKNMRYIRSAVQVHTVSRVDSRMSLAVHTIHVISERYHESMIRCNTLLKCISRVNENLSKLCVHSNSNLLFSLYTNNTNTLTAKNRTVLSL